MPSGEAARFVQDSLATNERREDFEFLLDELTRMRVPFHPHTPYEKVEYIAGRIICLIVVPKPKKYRRALQEFRGLFRGISDDRRLRAAFPKTVLPAALFVSDEDDVVFQPSLYFSPRPALLGRLRGDVASRREDLDALRSALPNWH